MEQENCIFCKIANGEIPSSTIYEDMDFRVFLDLDRKSTRLNSSHLIVKAASRMPSSA